MINSPHVWISPKFNAVNATIKLDEDWPKALGDNTVNSEIFTRVLLLRNFTVS